MFEQATESWFWLWSNRIAALLTLAGVGGMSLYLRKVFRNLSGRRRIEARPIRIEPHIKGLICCVSAPLPGRAVGARKSPEQIAELIERSSEVNDELRNGPLGSILKALELRHKHLLHCWLIASAESGPYCDLLLKAIKRYFPSVTAHVCLVPDVYARIDDVFETTHSIFATCEQETDGQVRPAEIVTDVTGGTKIMSIAVAMACLDANRQLQYIEQRQQKEFYQIDITWEKIAHAPAVAARQAAASTAASYRSEA
jgi:hypothetical protein